MNSTSEKMAPSFFWGMGICLLGVVGLATKTSVGRRSGHPRHLLIDTDAGFDVDDVGALCIANALADRGEIDIIAVAHTNAFVKGVGAISALLTYYGRTNVSLGAYKGGWARDPTAGAHRHHTADRYVSDLADNFPATVRTAAEVPSTVSVYRQALAAQEDHSVYLVSIGITTNMRDLVQSPPDIHSPLTGAELLARKAAQIVWMDGTYNFGCAQHATLDWLGPDVDCYGSAQIAVNGWPPSVHQVFTNVGATILHGAALATCTPPSNPCRQAFHDWGHGVARIGRMSWDPIAVLIAARGAADLGLCARRDGYNTVAADGTEKWVHDTTRAYNQSRVRADDFMRPDTRLTIAAELNHLLCQRPFRGSG
jgi:hypothetical protein